MKQNLKENKEEKMTEAYIIDAARTPRGIGKLGKGSLSEFHPGRIALNSPRHLLLEAWCLSREALGFFPDL